MMNTAPGYRAALAPPSVTWIARRGGAEALLADLQQSDFRYGLTDHMFVNKTHRGEVEEGRIQEHRLIPPALSDEQRTQVVQRAAVPASDMNRTVFCT
jgi:hypothetical protein